MDRILVRKIVIIAALLVMTIMTIFLAKRPYYNWDMFPYMAMEAMKPGEPFAETHQKVYLHAQEKMLPDDFERISQRQPALMADPALFQDILRYFAIKPLYLGAVSAFHWIGVDLLDATYMPSIVSFFLFGVLFIFWATRKGPLLPAMVLTAFTLVNPLVIDMARYSSPDMMCTFFSLAGFIAITSGHFKSGLCLLFLTIFIRPDACLLMGAVTAALLWTKQISRTQAIVAITLSAVAVAFLFRGMSIKEYLVIGNEDLNFAAGFTSLIHSYTIPFVLAAGAGLYWLYRSGVAVFADSPSLLLMAALGTIIMRFVLHPAIEDRFHAPAYLLVMMLLWLEFAGKYSSSGQAMKD